MSDTMNPRPTGMPPEDRPPGEAAAKSSSTLVWVLVLVALIALLWWFYSQRGAPEVGEVATPTEIGEVATPTEALNTAATQAPAAPARTAPTPASVTRAVALLERPAVSYPPEAYRAREEGRVLVDVAVDAAGNVTNATIVERSGSQILDRAALEQVRQWKFSPALDNGKPVASSIEVPVAYSLDEG
jgi:protein TonB